ncbi:hypothetical protein SAMN04487934_10191 [Eubacterium ruminantium]|nr:hypothetical protein SAMN04487934_10191 [Eubacterium ruminantium]
MERKKKKCKRILSLLLALTLVVGTLSSVGSKVYADEIYSYEFTVYDGTDTSEYLPLYGYYADAYQKSQYIIPAEDLSGLTGTTITELKYYLENKSEKKLDGSFKVYLKEIDNSVFADNKFLSVEDAYLFYEGELDNTGDIMEVVTNQDGYKYNGGNLLVSFFETVEGDNYSHAYFYGVNKENASLHAYSYDGLNYIDTADSSIKGFIPKTTIVYETEHQHKYSYTASDNVINVVCSDEDCGFHSVPIEKIILQAPEKLTNNGSQSPEVRIIGNIPEGTAYTVTYKKGDEVLDSAPIEAGTYTASLTIGEATATIDYTIEQGFVVCDGTNTDDAPINEMANDAYQKCQFIIPKENLTALNNKAIKGLRFFTAQAAKGSWAKSKFQVFLSETEETTFSVSRFIDTENSLLCYEGGLDATGSTMDVIFNKGYYEYSGENLLVSIFLTDPQGGYSSGAGLLFTGVSSEGSSLWYYNYGSFNIYNGSQQNFLPKTEFMIMNAHDHKFEYAADGPSIYAYCTSDDDCYFNNFEPSLTIKAPEYQFAESTEKTEATLIGQIPCIEKPEVVYKKGETILEAAPTEPGRYNASITVGTATASLDYVIGEGLTVNDGTDTSYIYPVDSYHLDKYSKIQYIIPADALTDMQDQSIHGMSFYISYPASHIWNSDFEIYLKEVEETGFSENRAFMSVTDDDLVYTGSLDATDPYYEGMKEPQVELVSSEESYDNSVDNSKGISYDGNKTMNVRFDNSFAYKGGNLLVTVYHVSKEPTSYSAYFYGVYYGGGDKIAKKNIDNDSSESDVIVSIAAYGSDLDDITNGDSGVAMFLPKTTFSYLPTEAVITANPVDTKVIRGSKAKFSVKAEGKNLTYKWQNSVDGETWTDSKATGYNTNTISFKATDKLDGRYFRCIVSNSLGEIISEPAKLTTLPVVSVQPKNAAGTVGSDAKFTFKSRSSAATFEWQISTDGGETWKKSGAEGNTTNTLTVPIKSGNYNGYMFRCKVTNGTWVEYTEAAKLSVKPAVTVQQKDVTEYYGNLVKLYVKASGTNPQYQWQVKSPTSGKWGNSSQAGNNTNILKFTSVESLNGREFRCKITDNGYTVYSDVVKFTAVSNILTQPKNVSVKNGGTAKFSIKATGTEGETSYYWQYSKDGGKTWTGIKVDGSVVTTDTLTLTKVTASQSNWLFRCRVKNRSIYTFSDAAKLTVK